MELMFARGRYTYIRVLGFPVLYGKREEGFKKRDMVRNVKEKIAENFEGLQKQLFADVLV